MQDQYTPEGRVHGPMAITLAAQKGGCGKTTSAVSLAQGLALRGHHTLLVDLDQQGHCAISLGFDPQPGVFGYLAEDDLIGNCTLVARGPVKGNEAGLTLMPGDSRSKHVGRFYDTAHSGFEFDRICRKLAPIEILSDFFEYVVFDTSASGLLQEAAVAIAHLVIIPFRPETLGLDGVAATLDVVRQLAVGPEQKQPQTKVVTLLPVMYDKRLSEHDYNLGLMRERYGSVPANSQQLTANGPSVADPIPARVAVAEAVAMGKTIWEMNSEGARDVQAAYGKLIRLVEIIQEGLPHD